METKLDKKGYERPEFSVIEISAESTVLQASMGGTPEDINPIWDNEF